MAEAPIPLDAAEDYLLGGLNAAARRRFEAQLARDPLLRGHLRAQQAGLLALALTTPQFRAPRDAWANIHNAIARDLPRQSAKPLRWLWIGWATAGGLAVLLFLLWFLRPADTAPAVVRPLDSHSPTLASGGASPAPVTPSGMASNKNEVLANLPLLAATNRPAAADESAPENSLARNAAAPVAHSRKLKNAVLLAMAHQLKWPVQPADETNVDYVELPNPMSDAATLAALSDTSTNQNTKSATLTGADAPEVGEASSSSASAIVMFAQNNNLTVVVDPSAIPASYRTLNVWVEDNQGHQAIVGTINLASNVTVITIANANLNESYQYYVTLDFATVIGHFPP
jgi:anti-sigma-K factor RskA